MARPTVRLESDDGDILCIVSADREEVNLNFFVKGGGYISIPLSNDEAVRLRQSINTVLRKAKAKPQPL